MFVLTRVLRIGVLALPVALAVTLGFNFVDAQEAQLTEMTRFVRGDVDDDGVEGITDLYVLLRYLYFGGETPGCLAAADANDDGNLDITDAVCLVNFLFRGGPAFSGPYPDCGLPAYPNGLSCREFLSCSDAL